VQQWWRPERFRERRAQLDRRCRILTATRSFFTAAGFVEVDTPALQASPGLEPHLRAFGTLWHDPQAGKTKPRFLHTSPEYAMKKLLVAGLPCIWQLAHAFRDGERSPTHHPEFALVEWYRVGASWRDLVADCEGLLRVCQEAAGAQRLEWQGRSADARLPFRYLSVAEAFARYAGIDILATAPDPLHPEFARLANAARTVGVAPHPGDDWEALYFRIFLDRVEPHLGLGVPTVLWGYPASMAALARREPADPRLAERFELYVGGLELANGFGELTDPEEQRARFRADQARRTAIHGESYPIDEDFLAALEYGMPPSAGIALGFDRLVMLATGARDIEEVLWAPVR
jgi:elongation factor P--(R)-beta-lysine ligase